MISGSVWTPFTSIALTFIKLPASRKKPSPFDLSQGWLTSLPDIESPFSNEAAMQYLRKETVREIMARPARTVAPELTLSDLLLLLSSNGIEACPVVRDGKLVGMVSRADSIKALDKAHGNNALDFNAIMGTTVEEIMSSRAVTVEPDASLEQVIHLMRVHDFESFPVVDHENSVKGIITREDVVRASARSTWRTSPPLPLSPIGYAIA
jgi:CBS domain-containing protein